LERPAGRPPERTGSGIPLRQNALDPGFHGVPAGPAYPGARERELGLAYRIAAEAQNRLGLTEPLDSGTADQVIDGTPALGELRYARAVASISGI